MCDLAHATRLVIFGWPLGNITFKASSPNLKCLSISFNDCLVSFGVPSAIDSSNGRMMD